MKKLFKEASKNKVTLFLFYFVLCTLISVVLYPALEYVFALFSKTDVTMSFQTIAVNSLRNGLIAAVVLIFTGSGSRRNG